MWGQTDEEIERKYNQVGWWLKLKEGEEQAESLNTEVSIYSGGDRTQMNWLQFSVDVGWLAVDLVSERLAVNFGLFISNDLVIQYIYLQAP